MRVSDIVKSYMCQIVHVISM